MTPLTHLDPVCGMPVTEDAALQLAETTGAVWFCSEFCRQQFLRHPGAYAAAPVPARVPVDWPARRVAYFSMEVALANEIPTYAGGLDVLAGDTLRSCADLEVPVVGVSLVHRLGYFRQELRDDWQVELPEPWTPEHVVEALPVRVRVTIEDREVQVRAWRHDVVGSTSRVAAAD